MQELWWIFGIGLAFEAASRLLRLYLARVAKTCPAGAGIASVVVAPFVILALLPQLAGIACAFVLSERQGGATARTTLLIVASLWATATVGELLVGAVSAFLPARRRS